MAITLKRVEGFLLGDNIIADSVTGTPTYSGSSPTPRSGAYGLHLNQQITTAEEAQFLWREEAGAPTGVIIAGFWVYFDAVGNAGEPFATLENGASNQHVQLCFGASGKLRILDANGSQVGSDSSSSFSLSTWTLVQVALTPGTGANGALDVDVMEDGGTRTNWHSSSSQDYDAGGTNCNKIRFVGILGIGAKDTVIDCFYVKEDGTQGSSDFLDDFEAVGLIGTPTTTGGTAPDAGAWSDTSNVPYNGGTSADFTQNPDPALHSYKDTDGGSYAGPSGNAAIDGDSNIKGATYLIIADRGGGGASGDVKDMECGNSADGVNKIVSLNLTTSPAPYFATSEAANVVPTSSEFARCGISQDGNRDFIVYEYCCQIMHVPDTAVSYELDGTTGSYAVTGQSAKLTKSAVVDTNVGIYSVTGVSAALNWSAAPLDTVVGSYAVTGQSANLLRTLAVLANVGSYSVVGQDANLARQLVLDTDVGSYAIVGQSANLQTGFSISTNVGSYSITGQQAKLTVDFSLAGTTGVYSVTGQQALLDLLRVLDTSVGSYSVVGLSAKLTAAYALDALVGSYSVTGQSALLQYSAGIEDLDATAGVYTISGQAALLFLDALLSTNVGVYTVTGQPANLIYAVTLQATTGTYTITGLAANLLRALQQDTIVGEYSITGQPANLIYSGEEDQAGAGAWYGYEDPGFLQRSKQEAAHLETLRKDDEALMEIILEFVSKAP